MKAHLHGIYLNMIEVADGLQDMPLMPWLSTTLFPEPLLFL